MNRGLLTVCLVLTTLTVSLRAQPAGEAWFCSDEDLTIEVFDEWFRGGMEVNYTELETVIDFATSQWDDTLQGLSFSEKLERIPSTFLFIQYTADLAYPESHLVNHFAVFEGFQRSANGTQVFLESLKSPGVWADALFIGLNTFNYSCYSDESFALMANMLIYLEPVLQPKYQAELADFLVGLTIELAKSYKAEQLVVDVLEPMVTTLEQSGDISGILSDLLSLASGDVVATAFEEAMKNSNVETDEVSWGKMMSAYFDLLQDIFDFEDAEFIDFITARLKEVVEALKQ